MSECASSLPWPCGQTTAGGTHPLGAILCPRHLAGVLVPIRAPDLDRAALRVRTTRADWTSAPPSVHAASTFDPETLDAIVALAPLGAAVHTWRPTYPRNGTLRMTAWPAGRRWRESPIDDPVVPPRARGLARKAVAAGWTVRITIVDDLIAEDVLLRCYRPDAHVAAMWTDGKFVRAWAMPSLRACNLTEATALLSVHTETRGSE